LYDTGSSLRPMESLKRVFEGLEAGLVVCGSCISREVSGSEQLEGLGILLSIIEGSTEVLGDYIKANDTSRVYSQEERRKQSREVDHSHFRGRADEPRIDDGDRRAWRVDGGGEERGGEDPPFALESAL